MPDFQTWLKGLETDLKSRVRDSRRFPSYVGDVICPSERFYVWKSGGRTTTRREGNVNVVELALPRIETVSPIPIRLRSRGEWRTYYEDKAVMVILGDFCKYIIVNEERIIAETLTRDARVCDIDEETFTTENLHEALSYINSQGNFADTMLVHPVQVSRLWRKKGFVSKYDRSIDRQRLANEKGKGFAGWVGQLSVYKTWGVSESEGIVYEKRQAKVRKTPLDISFDNYTNPDIFSVNEDMFAWTVEDGAIAKVTLQASQTNS